MFRIILGLIWTLILRYEIKSGEGDGKSAINELLEWVRSKIPEYDIKGFTKGCAQISKLGGFL